MVNRTLITRSVFSTVAIAALALTGCSSTAADSDTTDAAAASDIPTTAFSQEIHDSLPQEILDADELKLAGIILPPYAYFEDDGTTLQGFNLDVVDQLKSVLGVDISFETAPAITDMFTGLSSERFDASIAPLSDLPSTEESYDFADWLNEYVVFLVEKGNPAGIDSLETACGTTIATLQGGTAEKVLTQASTDCETAGNKAITINTFTDQNTAVLAVQSGRADAAFSSQIPLSYYVSTDDSYELAGANQLNGFPAFSIGAFAPKGSPLIQPLLDAFQEIRDSGAYDALLEKHGIEANAMDEFGINVGTAGQ
ncbi:transporter substrate-binding domain-containing protein [Microbacteriaceae bacterium VKM Ac-2854]|nr:transporter substrate-binding domain-containing protein [Microbacteriaceae bacterium VKM Ac-2854]